MQRVHARLGKAEKQKRDVDPPHVREEGVNDLARVGGPPYTCEEKVNELKRDDCPPYTMNLIWDLI